MKITQAILNKGKSSNNGWSYRQISLLGENQKNRGWKKRIIGKNVPRYQVEQFLELKDAHLRKGKKKKHKHKDHVVKKKPYLNG